MCTNCFKGGRNLGKCLEEFGALLAVLVIMVYWHAKVPETAVSFIDSEFKTYREWPRLGNIRFQICWNLCGYKGKSIFA